MMKLKLLKSIFHVLTLLGLLAALFNFQVATPVLAAGSASERALKALITQDGTLDLSSGYHGSLDIKNYSVALDPLRGPVFKPLMTLGLWNALGTTALNSEVVTVVLNGSDVYVGGYFLDAGGNPNADYIARWNGTAWSALGASSLNAQVSSIAINGSTVYVGGAFTNAGTDPNAHFVAQWDGTTWSALGTGLNNTVVALALSGTDLYAGGAFLDAGGDGNADFIAKWNGTAWSALGTGLNNGVAAIAISGADVYAGGTFTATGDTITSLNKIAKWDGATWSALGSGLSNTVQTIAVSGADVYAGGIFLDAGGDANADFIAKWNGTAWSALGATALNGDVQSIFITGTDVYAGGSFTDAGGDVHADKIAKWDGTSWSALGVGLNSDVEAIAVNGTDVYAGGIFTAAGGNAAAGKLAKFQPDLIAPTVAAIMAVDANPTSQAAVNFTVVFSEAVTGVDTTDFTATTAGSVTGASVISVSGSGTTYTVTASTGTGSGTLRLDALDNDSIQDLAGNPLNGAFSSGSTYTITKTFTVSFDSAATQDGTVTESSETSKKGGKADVKSTTFNLGDTLTNQQYLGILSFNTSSLPDTATIIAATLRVKRSGIVGGGNPVTTFKGFVVDIKTGFLGTAALQTSDFQTKASKTYGPFKLPLVGGFYSINLTSGQAYINKLSAAGGLTQIRLRFALDDNNNMKANYLKLFSGNAPAISRPQLIITYTIP